MAGESFYNPGVSNQSGQILAQGISAAGGAIGKGIEAMIAKTKALKATRAMAVDGLGMDPDEVDGMSLPQLQGTMAGEALKRSNVGQDLLQQNERLKATAQSLSNTMQQREMQWQDKFSGLMKSLGGGQPSANAGPPPGFMSPPPGMQPGGPGPSVTAMLAQPSPNAGTGGPPPGFMGPPASSGPPPGFMDLQSPNAGTGAAFDPRTIMNAAMQSGAPPRDMLDIAKSVMDEQRATQNRTPTFITDPVTGQRYLNTPGGAYGGGRTEPVAAQGSGPQAQYDEEGNVLGYSIPSGNGKSVFKPSAATPTGELKPVTVGGKTIPGFGMDEKGKVIDLRASTSKPVEGVDPGTAMAVRTAQRTLVNLKAAKAAGTTRVKVDPTGNVKDAGMFGRFGAGDPVDDLIKAQKAKLQSLQEDAGTSGGGAPSNGPATPKSQADFDALPSGTSFVNPADGQVMTKK